jgi:hypothetical protein
MKNRALAANAYGNHVAGDTLVSAFETINTSTIEQIEVVMIMLGSAEASNCDKKKASRAAFPAMNCAPSSPDPIMAVRTVGSGRQSVNLIRNPASYRITRIRVARFPLVARNRRGWPSSKNMIGRCWRCRMSLAISSSAAASVARRRAGSAQIAAIRRSWTGSGARRRTARPAAVTASRVRRRSGAALRVTSHNVSVA